MHRSLLENKKCVVKNNETKISGGVDNPEDPTRSKKNDGDEGNQTRFKKNDRNNWHSDLK